MLPEVADKNRTVKIQGGHIKMHNILLVDTHPFFLYGFRQYLNDTGRFSVSTAQNATGALALLAYNLPDIAIFDVFVKGGDGLRLLENLKETSNIRSIYLATHIDTELTNRAMHLGVRAVAPKSSTARQMIKIIDTVLADGTDYRADILVRAQKNEAQDQKAVSGHFNPLTPREKTIAKLACKGLRNLEIAKHCNLTEGTVKAHMHSIFKKLGVSSRAELIVQHNTIDTPKPM